MKKKILIISALLLAIFTFRTANADQLVTRNKVNPKVEIQANINKDKNNKQTDPDNLYYKLKMDFSVDNVRSGDYFNMELKGIPSNKLDKLDIRANNVEKTVIGKIFRSEKKPNTRDYQYNVGVPFFDTFRPQDSGDWASFQVIFNEEVNKLSSVSFTISQDNAEQAFALSDKAYEVDSYIKLNNEIKFQEKIKVSPLTKYIYVNRMTNWRNEAFLNNNGLYNTRFIGVIELKGDYTGKTIRFSMADDSKILFSGIKDTQVGDILELKDNFIFNDENQVNKFGLIAPLEKGVLKLEVVSIEEHKIDFKVVSQSRPAGVFAGTSVEFFVKDQKNIKNGKIEGVKYKFEILDGEKVLYSKSGENVVNIVNASVSSKTEDRKDDSKKRSWFDETGNAAIIAVVVVLVVISVIVAVAFILKKKN